VEAEKCWEVRGPAQGRWKQKGGWWRAKDREVTWGIFLFPFFVFIVIRVISIATGKES
jgi:hypothetical protein